ncbi:uncharacterized protein ColSpa_09303 [Colletotrichum spaethianum]|uniref:Uncharacterized protein n=1 Tax=Colletotrichum spaethianum TaxID=700344 RepID=A0AA37PBF2_9PEZI|nr:uncharacterized protein ColSpa_09303 [Colletotrichum spaethianum]GKT49122.1 hypothetical protein ColSpa_09303 [Colletotrichum spaethianum]
MDLSWQSNLKKGTKADSALAPLNSLDALQGACTYYVCLVIGIVPVSLPYGSNPSFSVPHQAWTTIATNHFDLSAPSQSWMAHGRCRRRSGTAC